MERDSSQLKVIQQSIVAAVILILVTLGAARYFIENHFLWNTQIEGVDCSFMTIEEALHEVSLAKESQVVTVVFLNGETYEVTLKELNFQIDNSIFETIFTSQHANYQENRQYDVDDFLSVDDASLRTFLESLHELQVENMREPQNAYIEWDGEQFLIQDAIEGHVIDFEEAVLFVAEQIKADETKIDFSIITRTKPEIEAHHLTTEYDELNTILNTSISFELADGSTITLDSTIIKNWIFQDENGKYYFNVEDGIYNFVETLATKVDEVNTHMHFVPTDCVEMVSLKLSSKYQAHLDTEKEIEEIWKLIGTSEPLTLKPIYDKVLLSDIPSWIEIDLTRQHVWAYKDGVLVVDTPCVTGKVTDGHATPPGVFFLLNKNRQVYLEGNNSDGSRYKAFVEYWMRFTTNGIGMHDASWRNKFGGEIYYNSGSHGCVNMPESAAVLIYEYIDNTMPIIVYNSTK